jgi:hypothetical protein
MASRDCFSENLYMAKPKRSLSVFWLSHSHSFRVICVLVLIGNNSTDVVRQSILGAESAASARAGTSHQDSNDGHIYKSKEHNFEIKFPDGWEVSKGESVDVMAVDHKGSSINVSVSPYNGPDPTERELLLMVNAGAAETRKDFPTAVIMAKGLRYLSGKKGPYQKFRVIYSAQGYSVTNITTNYTVFMNRRVYTITASAPLNSYAEIEPLLDASIGSFIVRDSRRKNRQ